MGFQREFAEILKEKMAPTQGGTSQKSEFSGDFTYEEHYQPFISAPLFSWSPSQISTQYPKSEPKKPLEPPVKPKVKSISQEKSYKIGELGMNMATPFMTLVRLGAQLDEKAITLSSLKREYRKLAKQYHPDHCSHPEAAKLFQSCCQSFRQIKKALNALSNN